MQSVETKTTKPALEGLFHQFLRRGIQYFLPTSRLDAIGSSPESSPEIVCEPVSEGGLRFEWQGIEYLLRNHREFTDHEQRLVRSVGRFLSVRRELLFGGEDAARKMGLFGGLTEDRYVSAFLERRVFDASASGAMLPDRISEAIDVLRISALSSYEDKRISTGALLFGSMPDTCHTLPARPDDALPYSSELTSIRSFHRICDGLRTLALVDARGYMVELVDVKEWAQPYSELELASPHGAALPHALPGYSLRWAHLPGSDAQR